MKRLLSFFFVFSSVSFFEVVAQSPEPTAVLRFDEMRGEELPDSIAAHSTSDAGLCAPDSRLPVVCKLNRRRVPFAVAYDEVTLWNVRRARVKRRCMRLSDSTRREPIRLLKFFVERSCRKGARPHLLGNVAGYAWSSWCYDSVAGRWCEAPTHISAYTLRADYDSVRRAGGDLSLFRVPDELWHPLSPDTRYLLDGQEVSGDVLRVLDGLVLRTLDVVDSPDGGPADSRKPRKQVVGTTYPERVPLVMFGGQCIGIADWLRMCRLGFFRSSAAVPMRFFYMLPAEAVSLYGPEGRYGAICIDPV